ncbi:scaffolding protein [Gordonia phage DelRio]|nr:scaffolding protein [Gordonia phage DelRio]
MAGISQVTKGGPKTFTPASGVTILGGTVVEARAAARIGPAAAGSVKVLGVALTDAIAPEQFPPANTTDALGRTVVSAVPIPTNVAVAYAGTEVRVKFAAAAQFGDRLKAGANGTAVPALETDDARAIFAVCTDPAGVANGATGLIRIL